MIPDDEPWWKVRETIDCETIDGRSMSGDSTLADKVCQGPVPNDIAMAAERQQAIKAEPASDTLQALDALPFRPIGYEW